LNKLKNIKKPKINFQKTKEKTKGRPKVYIKKIEKRNVRASECRNRMEKVERQVQAFLLNDFGNEKG
jgi:hypothetical protein